MRVQPRWILAAVLAVHVIFILSPPLALTDVFNYINYGRMEVVHHLNPYTTIPILEPHDDPSYALSNWHQLLSPYGPLFTMLTFARGAARRGRVVLGAEGGARRREPRHARRWSTVCARMLERDPVWAVAFVGLNPIVLVWGLGRRPQRLPDDALHRRSRFYLLLRARELRAGPVAAAAAARLARAALARAARGRCGVRRGRRSEGLRPRC